MPKEEHEKVAAEFYQAIMAKIVSIPGHNHLLLRGFGGTGFHPPGARGKQGDLTFGPATRLGGDQWPSVVIEVGYWQRLKALRMDAEWWLLNSGGETKFVIAIKIKRNPFAMHIECWKMIPTIRRQNRHTPAWTPQQAQYFDIDAAGAVTSTSSELCIPYKCIFDEDHDDAADVVFTKAELSSYALRVFSLL